MRASGLLLLCLAAATACSRNDGAQKPAPQAGGSGHSIEGGNWADSREGDAAKPGSDAANPKADGAHRGDGASPPACTKVAHIGDSLTAYTEASLTAAYQAQGFSVEINAHGGRAILEKLPQDPQTGKQAASAIAATGFSGCWLVALGTNDTANVAAGAHHSRGKAIDEMMKAIDSGAKARVLWVNTHSTKTSGYWSNTNMIAWNEALVEAQARWANLRIFDWASIAKTGVAPYADGLHHTPAGYEVRNKAIAGRLRAVFSKP